MKILFPIKNYPDGQKNYHNLHFRNRLGVAAGLDKNGDYVKKWVPELNKYPSKYIHKPWELDLKYQKSIDTVIGKDYPEPIVIHEEARKKALDAFKSLKKN